MGRGLDIAVLGCGPAGLAAALLLRRDGHRVTLFERFERPQPLGSGLMIQPVGLAVLDALGLGRIRDIGARIDRLIGHAEPSGRTALSVRYAALGRHAGFGLGVHRASLFELLFDAVTAERIPVETGRTVAAAFEGALAFADGAQAGPFDLVVDALGWGSPLAGVAGRPLAYGALWACLDWPEGDDFDPGALQQRYRAAHQMAGVLPIGKGVGKAHPQAAYFWSLRADRLDAWHTDGLARWKDEALALWPQTAPLLGQITDPAQFTFSRYAHRTLRRPVAPRLAHIGDAWHSTSPQLGQGANMALLDAYALAEAMRRTEDIAGALALYPRLRALHVRLYQAMSLIFTPAYQSDGRLLPWLRDLIVGSIAHLWPADLIQAAMVSGVLGGPLKPLGLRTAPS